MRISEAYQGLIARRKIGVGYSQTKAEMLDIARFI